MKTVRRELEETQAFKAEGRTENKEREGANITVRQWSKFKGERRENKKEGKQKFWRDGKKVGAE